jgi:hypothetical protein
VGSENIYLEKDETHRGKPDRYIWKTLVGLKVLGWHCVCTIHKLLRGGLREWKYHLYEQLGGGGQKEVPVGNVIHLNQPSGSHVGSCKAEVSG